MRTCLPAQCTAGHGPRAPGDELATVSSVVSPMMATLAPLMGSVRTTNGWILPASSGSALASTLQLTTVALSRLTKEPRTPGL